LYIFGIFAIILTPMEKLTIEQVEHIAKLARLSFDPEEKERFRERLSSILAYIGKLQEVDTSKVDPTAYILDLKNVTREDEVKSCPSAERRILIEDFPESKDDMVKTPAVF